ncbi:MAG: polysaccharide deacetylase family protein, partial [Bacteroidales bacterium]|nr:polysaccharide deacetylase family protein [Bacteroidales bacterium]
MGASRAFCGYRGSRQVLQPRQVFPGGGPVVSPGTPANGCLRRRTARKGQYPPYVRSDDEPVPLGQHRGSRCVPRRRQPPYAHQLPEQLRPAGLPAGERGQKRLRREGTGCGHGEDLQRECGLRLFHYLDRPYLLPGRCPREGPPASGYPAQEPEPGDDLLCGAGTLFAAVPQRHPPLDVCPEDPERHHQAAWRPTAEPADPRPVRSLHEVPAGQPPEYGTGPKEATKVKPLPIIYLTFDDGPTGELTGWILDVLESYDARATFFCLGRQVEKYPGNYRAIVDAGHAVGNHTY